MGRAQLKYDRVMITCFSGEDAILQILALKLGAMAEKDLLRQLQEAIKNKLITEEDHGDGPPLMIAPLIPDIVLV